MLDYESTSGVFEAEEKGFYSEKVIKVCLMNL